MTNAQKWLAAFLGLFIFLFLLGRVTNKKEEIPYKDNTYTEKTLQSNEEKDGLQLIRESGCTSCHGQNLEGSNIAPALVNLKEYWGRDNLINYLRNPSSFSNERMKEYRMKYKNIIMPSYNNLDVKDLGKIADYLLTR
ncbi:c-type cytochrome [Rosettibacter firmus]|uniref:c-type cytochrome n=1 Tax=Rosettibacter firmus TaxID=3111522 RepID=UPI00336C1458